MPTHLALDDDAINELVRIGKFKSKREAVDAAVHEFIERHKRASILELAGKVNYREDYDYKKLRSRKRK